MATLIDKGPTLCILGDKVKISNIEFNIWQGERGSRDSIGVPLEPDWPEEFELIAFDFESDCNDVDRDLIEKHGFEQIKEFVTNYQKD